MSLLGLILLSCMQAMSILFSWRACASSVFLLLSPSAFHCRIFSLHLLTVPCGVRLHSWLVLTCPLFARGASLVHPFFAIFAGDGPSYVVAYVVSADAAWEEVSRRGEHLAVVASPSRFRPVFL